MAFNRQQFIQNYGQLVANVWNDPNFSDTLKKDPVAILKTAGLDTVGGAVVRVVYMEPTGKGNLDEQIDSWLEGEQSGLYNLWIPSKPGEFGAVAMVAAADDTNTTCTPCCTCT